MTAAEMLEKLSSMLEREKFSHSVSVMREAAGLAAELGMDAEKAAVAGLLHDCACGLDSDTQIRLLEGHGEDPGDIGRRCPWVLHGQVGKWIAPEAFGVADRDVLDAICYHTLGRPGMTDLEKVVFIADFTEPTRTVPEVRRAAKEIRKAARASLDRALLMTIDSTLSYLVRTGAPIHPDTIAARNDILGRLQDARERSRTV